MRRRFEDSIAQSRRAQELDPLSAQATNMLAYEYVADRRYDEAIAQGQKAIELEPNVPAYRGALTTAYAFKGQYQLAINEFEKVKSQVIPVTTDNQQPASYLAWLYAVSGRRNDALKMAKEFEALSAHSYVDFYLVAEIYIGLGDKDQAFRWLEKAYQQRSNQIAYLAVDPWWYQVYSDPRYRDLIRRIGLPQPQ